MPLNKRAGQQRMRDVYHATRRIEQKVAGHTIDSFRHDLDAVDIVSYQILIIGEAVAHLPDDFKALSPHLDWNGMKAMRNVMAHHYWHIDVETLWQTATREVPALQAVIAQHLDAEVDTGDEPHGRS